MMFLREDQSLAVERLSEVFSIYLSCLDAKTPEEALAALHAASKRVRELIFETERPNPQELLKLAQTFGKTHEYILLKLLGLSGSQGSGKSTLLLALKNKIKSEGGEILLFSHLKSVVNQAREKGLRALSIQSFAASLKKHLVSFGPTTVAELASEELVLTEELREKICIDLNLPSGFFNERRLLLAFDESHDFLETASSSVKTLALVFSPVMFLGITATPRFSSVIPHIYLDSEGTVSTPLVSTLISPSIMQIPHAMFRLLENMKCDPGHVQQAGASGLYPSLIFFREVSAATLFSLSAELSGYFSSKLAISYPPQTAARELILKPLERMKHIARRNVRSVERAFLAGRGDEEETQVSISLDQFFELLGACPTKFEKDLFCLGQGRSFYRPLRKVTMGLLIAFFTSLWRIRLSLNESKSFWRDFLSQFFISLSFDGDLPHMIANIGRYAAAAFSFAGEPRNDYGLLKLTRLEGWHKSPDLSVIENVLTGENFDNIVAAANSPFSPIHSLSPAEAGEAIQNNADHGTEDLVISSILSLGTGFDAPATAMVVLGAIDALPWRF